MNPFYEALLERDTDAARAAARAYREEHSSHDLFLAVGRFAVLAYAPSQHTKHPLPAPLGEQGKFATLRTGVWEMTAYRGETYVEQGVALDSETLAARLLACRGDIVSAHNVFLLDAALECGDEEVLRRVRDYLSSTSSES